VSCLLSRATPLSLVLQDQRLGPSASRVKKSDGFHMPFSPDFDVVVCGRAPRHRATAPSRTAQPRGFTLVSPDGD
jgi:hypothetical protein